LLLLKEKGIITPTEIAEHFNFTMPGVSINLRILEEADLITEKKEGEKQIVLFEQKDNFRVSGIF
jgi:DNA-binding MarR family transcriptional regulator